MNSSPPPEDPEIREEQQWSQDSITVEPRLGLTQRQLVGQFVESVSRGAQYSSLHEQLTHPGAFRYVPSTSTCP